MYSHSDIQDAVEGGAITAEQAASLRNHVAAKTGTPTADEEHVRWFLGFSDLYVYVSSLLLLVGIGWLGYKITGGRDGVFLIPLLIGLSSWGLTEYFVKKKRLAMTAIALTWVFVVSIYLTVVLLAVEMIGRGGGRETGQIVSAIAAALAAGGTFLHWKRFGEPVAYAGIAGAVAVAIMSLLGLVVSSGPDTIGFVVLILIGLATLAYAQTWEAKDIHRTTKVGDIGFWLHYTAAFEVVIGLVGLLGLQGYPSQGAAIGGLVAFIVLILVGIVLDRRIWVLLGAWPGGVGIHTLLSGSRTPYDPYSSYGSEFGTSPYGGGYSPYSSMSDSFDNTMLTLLILGIILVAIGAFWSQIRGALGGLAGPLAGKIPPTARQDGQGQTFE